MRINAELIDVENKINLAHYDLLDFWVPETIDKKEVYGVYPKTDNQEDDKPYSYILEYSNNLNQSIRISFSKDNKPVRDYYFDDNGSKISNINGVELKIYKYEEIYMTEFRYKNINYDIETSNIKVEELSLLLQSIIKPLQKGFT